MEDVEGKMKINLKSETGICTETSLINCVHKIKPQKQSFLLSHTQIAKGISSLNVIISSSSSSK